MDRSMGNSISRIASDCCPGLQSHMYTMDCIGWPYQQPETMDMIAGCCVQPSKLSSNSQGDLRMDGLGHVSACGFGQPLWFWLMAMNYSVLQAVI